MKLRVLFCFAMILGVPQLSRAQDVVDPDPAVDPLPSLAADASAIGISAPRNSKDEFWQGWKKVPSDVLHDQQKIYFFPRELARKRHVKVTALFLGATAGLVALDGYPARYFARTKSFKTFNRIFSGPNTAKANYILPLVLYGIGLARRDTYAQKTFLLAGEAVLDAEILTSLSKDIDRRLNPHAVAPNGNYSDTWFKKKFWQNLVGGNGSFPSGHTTAAFAVASVYAERYRNHRWISWLAYGLAAADGVSRISLRSHWGSDVFAGAVIGYVMGHKVVLARR